MKRKAVDKQIAAHMALVMYTGEACVECGDVFETVESLKDAVFAGYHGNSRVAHKACWPVHLAKDCPVCAEFKKSV